MCGQGGQLTKLNYTYIKNMFDRWQALNKKGAFTVGEIKYLVRDRHDSRLEEELNHVIIEMEMKAVEKK